MTNSDKERNFHSETEIPIVCATAPSQNSSVTLQDKGLRRGAPRHATMESKRTDDSPIEKTTKRRVGRPRKFISYKELLLSVRVFFSCMILL